ncbi:formate/nitrite transporter family protein [Paraclostridium sp. AKS73]|uniref:formate/nitrite transporter family protein n=1 Tax=Paraclostridium sp. AKS73 TaxID=2876116 RepID=UPI0021E0F416|nr:formate/nitrite transporter family protein [Paraclostridium sp. AKS73]MCU9814890.1 formate/nitrite transporter family protein [Paraclostridium sp. AKS73]
MDKSFLTPIQIANATVESGIKKSKLSTKKSLLLGILAGLFIGLGALGNILISQTIKDPGLAKFAGASIFPIGLMLVVVCGAELFTGNNLMSMAVMDKKITIKEMIRNWVLVYIANFIGAIILVAFIYFSDTLVKDAAIKSMNIAQSKAILGFTSAFLKGVMCNIIVVLAVWFATAGKDIVSKIFACWFPIMLFVLCGFEHSIANMFFIPMGMVLGADVSILQLIFNLIAVTLGNIVGGAIIVPYIYYNCYLKED